MKYIHYFKTSTEYTQAKESVAASDPWVSYCERYSLLTYSPSIDVQSLSNGHDYVDLGLPSGTLWATMNIGANDPEDYGDYFAWGETETKSDYSWSTYAWGTSENDITKYNQTDRKRTLDLEDDAAHVLWGGAWKMPTTENVSELFDYTTHEYITVDGGKLLILTSQSNSNSITFALCGYKEGTNTWSQNSELILWTASRTASAYAYMMKWNPEESGNQQWPKIDGCPVRGVISGARVWYNPLLL